MEFNIDFMGKRKIAYGVSGILLVGSLISFVFSGLNLGLDYTGGNLIEIGFDRATSPDRVRLILEENGFNEAVVQNFGSQTDILVRVPPSGGGLEQDSQVDLGDRVVAVLNESLGGVTLRRSEFVGPAVGAELAENGSMGLLVALGAVMIYIMFRFTGKFAVGAVSALAHDVVIVIGAFSIFGWTANLPELAALLAVIGYSLNDTIVVSDRIRENFRTVRRGSPEQIINQSLNQTLGRTLVTSLTTLLVLFALLFAGGEQVSGFAIALAFGVVVGTYSSVYVAASVLLLMQISKQDLALPDKEIKEGSL